MMEYPNDEEFDKLIAQRQALRALLPDVVAEISTALHNAELPYPVFLSVPEAGWALASVATPLDPSHDDWRRIGEIARRVIGQKVGVTALRSTELACAAAQGSMSVVDLRTAASSDDVEGH